MFHSWKIVGTDLKCPFKILFLIEFKFGLFWYSTKFSKLAHNKIFIDKYPVNLQTAI